MGAKGKAFYEKAMEAAKIFRGTTSSVHTRFLTDLSYARFTKSILGDREAASRIARSAYSEVIELDEEVNLEDQIAQPTRDLLDALGDMAREGLSRY